MRTLRKQLPDATLFLLIGEDMLAAPWLAWGTLKRLCTVVVAHRAGRRATRAQAGLKWLQMPRLDIASSDIRARLKSGRSIRYLVPAAVERYIRSHRLYQR